MLDFSNGNIAIYFARTLKHAASISYPALIVTVDKDTGWNDFSYNFHTHLNLLKTPEITSLNAPMRLMFQGEKYTSTHMEKLFAQFGPLIPREKIEDDFCSILVGDEFYRELVSELTLDDAVHGLWQLGDAVVLEASVAPEPNENPDPRLSLIRSKSFHLGALRQSKAYSAWRRAKRHLRNNPPTPVEDAASKFSFKSHLPGLTNPYELEFDFSNKDELLRNRIAVLIGKNGVGKTQILLSIIKALDKSAQKNQVPGALTAAEFNSEPAFNSLLVFSSASSDFYPEAITPWDGEIDYSYFSITARVMPSSKTSIDTLTASLADIIRSGDTFEHADGPFISQTRADILKKALKPFIEYDSVYLPLMADAPLDIVRSTEFHGARYASIEAVRGEQRTLDVIRILDWKRSPIIVENGTIRILSSGQLAMMRFAVQAIGAIQMSSLVLLDEPETHLHPNFISVFVDVLHSILEATRSCAIIATHSAYIVREVPRSKVNILKMDETTTEVSQPRLQTFGASIDSISRFVFGDAEIEHLHETLLLKWLSNESSIDAILEKHGAELSPESLSYIRRRLEDREPQ